MSAHTLQAHDYRVGRLRSIRAVALHGTVTPAGKPYASRVAAAFHKGDPKRPHSAHRVTDGVERWTCVADGDTAFAAKGANADFLHLEMCMRPTRDEHAGAAFWQTEKGRATYLDAVEQVAEWCHRYAIPVRWLTPPQVADGKSRGICDHAVISRALPSSGHWDVGAGFPVATFLRDVKARVARLAKPTPPPAHPVPHNGPAYPLHDGYYFAAPTKPRDAHAVSAKHSGIGALQRRLKVLGYYAGAVDNDYGPRTRAAVIAAQHRNRLREDGIAGRYTWAALFRGDAVAAAH